MQISFYQRLHQWSFCSKNNWKIWAITKAIIIKNKQHIFNRKAWKWNWNFERIKSSKYCKILWYKVNKKSNLYIYGILLVNYLKIIFFKYSKLKIREGNLKDFLKKRNGKISEFEFIYILK